MFLQANNVLVITDSELGDATRKFKSSLNPVYTPADVAQLMINLDPKLNGRYRVVSELARTGDSRKFSVQHVAKSAEVVSQETMLEDLNSAQEVHITKDGIRFGPEEIGSGHLKDARDLLNYAAKTVKNFSLTSASISVTVDDIKFEVSVTK